MSHIAIIAAGGTSGRTGLGEYTTKAALLLAGKPLIRHQLDFVRRSNVDRVFIIARPQHVGLLGSLLTAEERALTAFLVSDCATGWAGEVERAAAFVGDDDEVVLISCDNYHTAERVEWLDGRDSRFTHTRWDHFDASPTNGPVYGRRTGDVWKQQAGTGFNGDLFTGYIVARGEVLIDVLQGLKASLRGEKEITALLTALQLDAQLDALPYPGDYLDVADLDALARIHARVAKKIVTEGAVEIGAGVVLRVAVLGQPTRVLLTDRQDNLGWTLPGGMVDEGETYVQAALRELREEVGVTLAERDLRLLGAYPTVGKTGAPACSVIFHATLSTFPQIMRNPREIRRTLWFSDDEARGAPIPFDLGDAVADAFADRELDVRATAPVVPAALPAAVPLAAPPQEDAPSPAFSSPAASFTVRFGLVSFSSNRAGGHATMFGPDSEKLAFSSDASHFDDDARSYTWAFLYSKPLVNGERFIFATADREVLGLVTGKKSIAVHDVEVTVAREDGKPIVPLFPSAHYLTTLAEQVGSNPSARVHAAIIRRPKVSVITCTYNRPKMLRDAVACIRAQSDPDWEHLVYDAGSTSPGITEVLAWVAEDKRARVWRATSNVDQPAKYWDMLLDRATGKYLCFLDDDNSKSPDFVKKMSALLDEWPDVDMVTCGFTVVEEDGSISGDNHLNLATKSEIHRRNTVDTGAFLVRREAFEKLGYFPLDIRTNEDWAMMRRAAACLRVENLPDALVTYRKHGEQRMARCAELGNQGDKVRIEGSGWAGIYGVRVYQPPMDLLTASQRDVVDGGRAGIGALPWVGDGPEMAVLFAPFRMTPAECGNIAAGAKSVVSVHSEDPYALEANLERVQAMVRRCSDTWVVTNDTASVDAYQKVVGNRVVACSCLSVDERFIPVDVPRGRPEGDDVLLVGYASPSRVKFVKELLQHFDGACLRIRGDGWKQAGFPNALPTAGLAETYKDYAAARAVICLHRLYGDCGGGPHKPQLVQRGYVEGMGGARVFLDTERPDHAFDAGDVEWFSNERQLAQQLRDFFDKPVEVQAALGEPLQRRALTDFTYRERMARIINCVRSPRFEAVIP